ncbi:MAG TPA: hypothetical protein VKA27_09645 [Sunxiuqinia sp.]|nr:hypothetical protein [Sunxiuqinia sp.]
MKKLVLFLGFTLLTVSYLFAQHDMKPDDDWIQKIKAEKVAFLTTKLQLTPEEAQSFWPVYNEFDNKRFKIHMQRREMEHKTMENTDGMTDDQLKALSNKFVNLFQQEADLMKEYNKQFFKVLPAKKVVMLYDVENDFRYHMLKEYRKKKEEQKK